MQNIKQILSEAELLNSAPIGCLISRVLQWIALKSVQYTGAVHMSLQSRYLSFAGWGFFFLLPLLRLSSPPPQLSTHTALKVRHLPKSDAATQSQYLCQTHAVHCKEDRC